MALHHIKTQRSEVTTCEPTAWEPLRGDANLSSFNKGDEAAPTGLRQRANSQRRSEVLTIVDAEIGFAPVWTLLDPSSTGDRPDLQGRHITRHYCYLQWSLVVIEDCWKLPCHNLGVALPSL